MHCSRGADLVREERTAGNKIVNLAEELTQRVGG
jgi:hypothetical protein